MSQALDELERGLAALRLPGEIEIHPDNEYPSQVALTEEDADLVIKWLAIRERTVPDGETAEVFLMRKGDDRVAVYWQGMMRAGFAVQIIDDAEVRWRFTRRGLHLQEVLQKRGYLGRTPPERA